MATQPQKQPQTIVIDNFTGALTRQVNGPMNSGLAQFGSSYGYNPFIYPKTLTWMREPDDITDTITGLYLGGQTRIESGVLYLYGITDTGKFAKTNVVAGTSSILTTLSTGTPAFSYGSSVELFNGKVWISNDKGLTRIDFDGTNETQVGTWDSSHFIQDTYHPLIEFQGQLLIGNTTDGTSPNIGTVDTTNTITNYSRLSPSLPFGTYVKDMDIASDFSYVELCVSEIPPIAVTLAVTSVSDGATGAAYKMRWNGTDTGITSGTALPSFMLAALQNYGDNQFIFMNDTYGMSLLENGSKILTLPFVKTPHPNATSPSGDLVGWGSLFGPRATAFSRRSQAAIFAYGYQDGGSQPGLYQFLNKIPASASFAGFSTFPFLKFIYNNTFNFAAGTFALSAGFVFFSTREINGVGGNTPKLWRMYIDADSSLISGATVQSGYYTTQVQLFSKKIGTSAIRIYCDEPAVGSAFSFTLNTNQSSTSQTFTYTYGDPISSGRINFNPSIQPTFGLGFTIANTGTENMYIRKVEIDVTEEGK